MTVDPREATEHAKSADAPSVGVRDDAQPTFAVDRVSKAFGTLQALRDVSLTVRRGEVHAVVGSNGSGKSTLVKVLTGVYTPDKGTIRLGEASHQRGWSSPIAARSAGVAVVHQEAPLIDNVSIMEMLALNQGWLTTQYGRISWRRTRASAKEMLARFDIALEPETVCGRLTDSQRAVISLALSLETSATEVLVLDEATAAIPQDEATALLERVRRVAEEGSAVIMVTHRIPEVRQYAHTVTVLAAGRVVYQGPVSEITDEEIVELMVTGQQRSQVAADRVETVTTPIGSSSPRALRSGPSARDVEYRGLRRNAGRLDAIEFTIAAGEILGFAGLPDSGVLELPMLVSGASPADHGSVSIAGTQLASGFGPPDALAAGVAMLPRDRSHDGGIRTLSIRENMSLPAFGRYWHRGKVEVARIWEMIDLLDIRPRDPKALFGKLSGGNQQKVILARWLLLEPTLLVLDDPTYGVDPASRRSLFRVVREHAKSRGLAVLMLSTEPEQLAEVCDRVIALQGGRIANEMAGQSLTSDAVARWSAM